MAKAFKTAVIGLGSMGYGIAASCLRAGHQVWGVDVNSDAADRFKIEGGQDGDLPTDLDALVIVVLNAAQTESVLFGETGLVSKLAPSTVVMSCTTVPPDFARKMEAWCEERRVHYLDAPISGGAAKSAQGALTIMAAGKPAAFAAAQPILSACAETVFELGTEAGPGSAMKAVNQLLAGVHIATMAEALTFGMTQGIAPDQFVSVISKCAGTSWMLENRAPHIVDGDYSPKSQINIWPKDLGIVLDAATSAGFSAPIAVTALKQYQAAVEMGLGAEDDASVAKVYAHNAGLKLPTKKD